MSSRAGLTPQSSISQCASFSTLSRLICRIGSPEKMLGMSCMHWLRGMIKLGIVRVWVAWLPFCYVFPLKKLHLCSFVTCSKMSTHMIFFSKMTTASVSRGCFLSRIFCKSTSFTTLLSLRNLYLLKFEGNFMTKVSLIISGPSFSSFHPRLCWASLSESSLFRYAFLSGMKSRNTAALK